ncbi:hypothetical protein AAVH_09247 [Aphelenchoides avenae]|nr:hypothetical protein AAVH_09247 [Aphelenchus avenae]
MSCRPRFLRCAVFLTLVAAAFIVTPCDASLVKVGNEKLEDVCKKHAPCLHGGSCFFTPLSGPQYLCQCTKCYEGSTCENLKSDCEAKYSTLPTRYLAGRIVWLTLSLAMGALAFVAFFYRDRVVRKHGKYQVESINDVDNAKPSIVVVPPCVSESISSVFWDETQWSNMGEGHVPNVPPCEPTITSSEITEPTQPMSHRSATNVKTPPPKSCRSDEALSRTPAKTLCSKNPAASAIKQNTFTKQQIQAAAEVKPAPAKDDASTNIATVPKKTTTTVLPIPAMNSESPLHTPQPTSHCQTSMPTARAEAGRDWHEDIERALFDYSVACKSDPYHGGFHY